MREVFHKSISTHSFSKYHFMNDRILRFNLHVLCFQTFTHKFNQIYDICYDVANCFFLSNANCLNSTGLRIRFSHFSPILCLIVDKSTFFFVCWRNCDFYRSFKVFVFAKFLLVEVHALVQNEAFLAHMDSDVQVNLFCLLFLCMCARCYAVFLRFWFA